MKVRACVHAGNQVRGAARLGLTQTLTRALDLALALTLALTPMP